ncbi:hypothetical protein WDW89_07885 [Deltaproteobacteria bacterium TL4]
MEVQTIDSIQEKIMEAIQGSMELGPSRKQILALRASLLERADRARQLKHRGQYAKAYFDLVKCRASLLGHPESFSTRESSTLLERIDSLRRACQDEMEKNLAE